MRVERRGSVPLQRALFTASQGVADRSRRGILEAGLRPAEPGDVFVLAATAEWPVEWALLDRPRAGGPFLALPAPSSADVAASWWDRGNDALSNRDFRTARERYARAAFLLERAAPGTIYLAEKLLSLGASEFFLGDLDAAERTLGRSLALAAREAPDDPVVAGSLQGLGDVAMLRKDWRGAEQSLTRALHLVVASEAGPQALSDLLHEVGAVERRLGKQAEGTAFFCRAMQLVDREWRRSEPNQEMRLRWGFRFADLYRDCSQSLAELGEA